MERKILKASDGMILTDGNIYGTEIYLADDSYGKEFREITLEEYNALTSMEDEYYE